MCLLHSLEIAYRRRCGCSFQERPPWFQSFSKYECLCLWWIVACGIRQNTAPSILCNFCETCELWCKEMSSREQMWPGLTYIEIGAYNFMASSQSHCFVRCTSMWNLMPHTWHIGKRCLPFVNAHLFVSSSSAPSGDQLKPCVDRHWLGQFPAILFKTDFSLHLHGSSAKLVYHFKKSRNLSRRNNCNDKAMRAYLYTDRCLTWYLV